MSVRVVIQEMDYHVKEASSNFNCYVAPRENCIMEHKIIIDRIRALVDALCVV